MNRLIPCSANFIAVDTCSLVTLVMKAISGVSLIPSSNNFTILHLFSISVLMDFLLVQIIISTSGYFNKFLICLCPIDPQPTTNTFN